MAEFELTIEGEATPETVELFRALTAPFPRFCPNCNFTHDSALWVKRGTYFFCGNGCGYILLEADCWHNSVA